MARATLRRVVKRCLDDKKFFGALVRNPESTLTKAKMRLSAADMRKLKRRLRHPVIKVNILNLIRNRHTVRGPIWYTIPIWWFGPVRRTR